jgi:hypothetical protein
MAGDSAAIKTQGFRLETLAWTEVHATLEELRRVDFSPHEQFNAIPAAMRIEVWTAD